MKVYGRDPR